jgi:hypothetical protein
MSNIAFLELKYGNINGGYPNYFVISDISLLVFDQERNKVFIESFSVNEDIDVVFVNTRTDELGHTLARLKYVVNLKTRKKARFDEELKHGKEELDKIFYRSRGIKRHVQNFFYKIFKKYRIDKIVTFDGNRDIFLCERSGADFKGMEIFDLQKALNQECNYLFSLNKLAVITGFDLNHTSLKSNNIEYFLHPIAAKQVRPKTAAFDAARLLMAHQEFLEHKDDFLMKAALVLNKISLKQKERAAAEKAAKAKAAEATKETEGAAKPDAKL